MKEILKTILITLLVMLLLAMGLLTFLILRPVVTEKITSGPTPDYVIAEEEENYEEEDESGAGTEDESEDGSEAGLGEQSQDGSENGSAGQNFAETISEGIQNQLQTKEDENTLYVWGKYEPTLQMVDMSAFQAGTVLNWVNEDCLNQYFTQSTIDEKVLNRILGKSYEENEDISLNDLRYLKFIHYNYNHEIQVGEMIVNKQISQAVLECFEELYQAQYEIYSACLLESFWEEDMDGNDADQASDAANNSSAFCYRKVLGTDTLSSHALGLSVDINPLQNPQADIVDGRAFTNNPDVARYLDRTADYEHMITEEDVCYQIFTRHGFSWGGSWLDRKDYMHFEMEAGAEETGTEKTGTEETGIQENESEGE